MLNWIAGKVGSTDVVTIHHGRTCGWNLELMKELPEPTRFSHTVSNTTIFSLGTGS